MPKDYNVGLLDRFEYSYEQVGSILNIFSQQMTIEILRALENKRWDEISKVYEKEMDKSQRFVVSHAISLLREGNMITKTGREYVIKNDVPLTILEAATMKIHTFAGIREKSNAKKELTPEEIREVALIFSQCFFDRSSNIIIHMSFLGPMSLSQVQHNYRNNHGYISLSTLRYHLMSRTFTICGKKMRIFAEEEKKFKLSPFGAKIHETFDEFIGDYLRIFQEKIKKIWGTPVGELAEWNPPIVYLRDRLNKVIHLMGSRDYLLAFSSDLEGMVSTESVIDAITANVEKKNFIEELSVKDVMRPVETSQVVDEKIKLEELVKNGAEHRYYLVRRGKYNYGVLDLGEIMRRIPGS